MTLANAGHLAPWVDGEEVDGPHDLPLGIAEEIEYEERRLELPETGTLTLIFDGVVDSAFTVRCVRSGSSIDLIYCDDTDRKRSDDDGSVRV